MTNHRNHEDQGEGAPADPVLRALRALPPAGPGEPSYSQAATLERAVRMLAAPAVPLPCAMPAAPLHEHHPHAGRRVQRRRLACALLCLAGVLYVRGALLQLGSIFGRSQAAPLARVAHPPLPRALPDSVVAVNAAGLERAGDEHAGGRHGYLRRR